MANLVGRVTSGYIAAFARVPNLTIAVTIASGILILGMIGLKSLASVIALGVIFQECTS
ncbi:hypothetical protein AZE42_08271 [Rhizopogon vesiculosus]|uniref:Uncharacterized protein n=1 Tax=Rhizopogon vesiculosus TaxID=180088 RepID=A0A1J8QHV4_9AGAM|nr:hypothetical protein AZE42_08271 [Rhizopogon vesiculosus]